MRPFGAARRAGTLLDRRGAQPGKRVSRRSTRKRRSGTHAANAVASRFVVSCTRVAGPVSGSVADAAHRTIYMGRSKLCFCVAVDLSYSTDDGEEFS